jgi:hypothetical protein
MAASTGGRLKPATTGWSPQRTYLVAEVGAMAALLRRARMLWRDYTSALLDAGPLMVLLATGCEKLLSWRSCVL